MIGHWGKNQELSSDGIITEETIEEIRKCNFSSRATRKEVGTKDIVDLIDAVKKHGKDYDYRKLVEKDHDIKKSLSQYLDIADTILKDGKRANNNSRKNGDGSAGAADSRAPAN